MKRFIAFLTVISLLLCLGGCRQKSELSTDIIKVGMVCIGDDNSAYDRNFYKATEKATAILKDEGITVEWMYQYNFAEGDGVTVANTELAEAGCDIIFNNSYGQESEMLKVAAEYPDIQFVGMTNEASAFDELDNTHNAFVSIYEGRYLAGVVAGLKLNELLAEGKITEPKVGYVGAYAFAEVISGYTAYFLGIQSMCPAATMEVVYVNSWSNASEEAQAAMTLATNGCSMISQHSDNTTPATEAQKANIFHTGYNIAMDDVAPEASIVSTYIDWTNYFVYAIESVYNNVEFAQDWCGSLANGDVALTDINEDIAAEGTNDILNEVTQGLISGKIKVFDTTKFTVNGGTVYHAYALDTDGDWVADDSEAIINGEFKESYFKSAPYFSLKIDGITELN